MLGRLKLGKLEKRVTSKTREMEPEEVEFFKATFLNFELISEVLWLYERNDEYVDEEDRLIVAELHKRLKELHKKIVDDLKGDYFWRM